MNTKTVYDCSVIELDRHSSDRKGNLSVVSNLTTVPFQVKRVFYIYDVPGGENRGAHAHRSLFQLIIAASGSFTVTLDDGNVRRSFTLNHPYKPLFVHPGSGRLSKTSLPALFVWFLPLNHTTKQTIYGIMMNF